LLRPRFPRLGLFIFPGIQLAPAILLYVVHFFGQDNAFVDDSYIFYRYAQNFAAGHGLVYNLGDRVEGYSSLLWTVMLALAAHLPLALDRLAPILGLLLGIASLAMLGRLTGRLFPRWPLLRWVLPLALGLSTGFVYYAASGMDTALFGAVLLFTVSAALEAAESGRIPLLSVSLTLLVLVRSEGLLYALAVLGALGRFALARRTRLNERSYLVVVAITLSAILLQACGRYLVYREWAPATVLAKLYTGYTLSQASLAHPGTWRPFLHALWRGVTYERFALPVLLAPAIYLVFAGLMRHRQPLHVWLFAAPIALSVCVTVWAAGDWMPYHRHIAAVWPLVLLLLATVLTRIAPPRLLLRRPQLAGALVGGMVTLVGVYSIETSFRLPDVADPQVYRENGVSLYLKQVGTSLSGLGQPVTVLTDLAGKLAYFAGPTIRVKDSLGLTDSHNARYGTIWSPTYGRTDPSYTFGERVDVMVTNTTSDLKRLLRYAHAQGGNSPRYVIYLNPGWVEHAFFVVADASSPAAQGLTKLAGHPPVPLHETLVASLRGL